MSQITPSVAVDAVPVDAATSPASGAGVAEASAPEIHQIDGATHAQPSSEEEASSVDVSASFEITDADLDRLAEAFAPGHSVDFTEDVDRLGGDETCDFAVHPHQGRELVGGGVCISLRGFAGSGEERWAIHRPDGEMVAVVRGREAAEQAARQLAEEGRISR